MVEPGLGPGGLLCSSLLFMTLGLKGLIFSEKIIQPTHQKIHPSKSD
jgi:hypothetical protein